MNGLEIIAQTQDYIAVNKPSGLLTIADREGKELSVKHLLLQQFPEVFTVHRLDRDTSGLVIFALNADMHRHLSMQFENRQTSKIYNGLVLGQLAQPEGVINEPIAEHPTKKGTMTVYRKGKESITEYKVLNQFRLYSWMEFNILTGRTHQIRVHMKHAGHPIVCDPTYGDGKAVFLSQIKSKYKLSSKDEEERPMLNRLALHASKLTFAELNGETRTLEASLSKDMRAVVTQLSKS